MAPSLYLHVPFCVKRCAYCDFVSGIYSRGKETAYAEALKREVQRIDNPGSLSTLYIGGGTPTVLSGVVLSALVGHIFKALLFAPEYEATIEANPGLIETDKLLMIRSSGITRISIGVQSFNRNELKTLGRLHGPDDAEQGMQCARRCGFDNIGIDLIYGIPGQCMDSWRETLQSTVRLRPEHISTYELTLEEGTKISRDISKGRYKKPEDEMVVAMYNKAIDYLSAEGYEQYEISNFALPGYRCRHNLNYWDAGDYYGVGLGAHSHISGVRYQNTENLDEYIDSVHRDAGPVISRVELTPDEKMSEALFLGLRKTDGIDLKRLLITSGFDILSRYQNEIKELEEAGLLEKNAKGSRIRLTRRGLLLSNEVFLRFV